MWIIWILPPVGVAAIILIWWRLIERSPIAIVSTKSTTAPTDEFDYETRVDVNIAILREMAKIQFKERLPRIMTGVAQHLMAAGVDFSKVDFTKLTPHHRR